VENIKLTSTYEAQAVNKAILAAYSHLTAALAKPISRLKSDYTYQNVSMQSKD